MATKEEIRPFYYAELQGYLSQAPGNKISVLNEALGKGLWEQVNQTINELNQMTGEDYNRFKIVPETEQDLDGEYYSVVPVVLYRSKINGLISRLHGKYFSDEIPPFSGTPTAVFSQSQEQTQTFQVQLLLEVQSKIDEKLSSLGESNKKEKGFLEKVKSRLSSIRTVAQLILLLLSTAKECGLSIDELKALFN